jgi:adenylosuccinate lyase
LIAFRSLLRGLGKLILNEERIRQDLNENWSVVTEAIQTILRREGYPEPYEVLKSLTRTHKTVDQDILAEFIQGLDVPEAVKKELLAITPKNYTGIIDF